MKVTPVSQDDLQGVFAVPPLARSNNQQRTPDLRQNDLIVRHIAGGGITRFMYGGNAFLYHITLAEYEELLEWLSSLADAYWAIPSLGPSYGRAIDQAMSLRKFRFPCAMILPCGDPRDAAGLASGYRQIAETARTKLIIYLKDEDNFGPDREAGLDAVAELVNEGVCCGIKYAVVRHNPLHDAYLEALLKRVDRRFVISGIGERPAVTHLTEWKLPGFTTGSGCLAPALSQMLFTACQQEDHAAALSVRSQFLPLEDLRDLWHPAKVLHVATALAEIAETGPIPPYLSDLSDEQKAKLLPVAKTLEQRSATSATKVDDQRNRRENS